MKFNENLIELRKKQGLSQEELGYKLNVTRQTVSKWELGQTTPEMDKLIEISKLFNISVDELIRETEEKNIQNEKTIEDEPIQKKDSKEKNIKFIIIALLVIVIILIVIKVFSSFASFSIVNKASDSQGDLFDKVFSVFNKAKDTINKEIDIQQEEFNQKQYNWNLEMYKGSNKGLSLKKLLDKIIAINKKESKKVTIKYLEIETQNEEEIKNLKTNFNDSNNYEVTFEYDTNGYIYEATIERVVSEFEITAFNSSLEIYSGTKKGGTITTILDKIITINKTKDRQITVKYLGIETQDEEEIKNIKQKINTFDDHEVTFEYDKDRFINKAIIEKL